MSIVRVTFNDGRTAERSFGSLDAALAAARVYARIVRVSFCLVWESDTASLWPRKVVR
jgi:hypothetical protein